MATIQDIADEVGISKAAVSRILNKKGSFNAETIEKVLQTAKNLNYILPKDNSTFEEIDLKIIAAVFPTGHIPYYSVLTSLLEEAAYSYGYSLMICSSLYNKEKEATFFERLKEKKINGIVYGSFNSRLNIEEVERLPIVTVGHKISEKIPVIKSDNYMAGIIAGKHLLSRKITKCLYISGNQISKYSDERYKGLQYEMEKNNVELYSYFTGVDERLKDIPSVITRMLIDHPDADAIFAESYTLAVNCVRVATNLGIKVPNQLRIVGYGNDFLGKYSIPKISLVKENTLRIAQSAISQLVEMIEDVDTTKKEDIIVPVSFEKGETS